MTPGEALKAAIEMNDLKWVQELLDRYICDYSDAMADAAGLNRLDVVNLILTDIPTNRSASLKVIDRTGSLLDDDSDDMLDIMQKSALSAARNGHVAVLERLLRMVIDQVRYSLLPFVIQCVLDEGAVQGQLAVVQSMIEHTSTRHYRDLFPRLDSYAEPDDTLPKAIRAGQSGVVEYLVNEMDSS
ncbi:hypothetical protein P3T76_007266 [Phytophthora citrophthora]|uniref:Uncharacterized protein n=1 Tax=Phytophthora citrophthora TaxID=4793 RepID=A0AAD9GMZ1_9STRA|nr:hypothetical protein P3T76_007266 [Phytophthora citrophthora]